jgi:hypothetical protein
MIELKYKKNEKFEIEFENLNEIKIGNDVFIKLLNGDITPLLILHKELDNVEFLYEVFISGLSSRQLELFYVYIQGLDRDNYIAYSSQPSDIKYNIFDVDSHLIDLEHTNFKNTIPNWLPYIDKDSAVLFLNKEDYSRYATDSFSDVFDYSQTFIYPKIDHPCNKLACTSSDCRGVNEFKTVSIIISELHSKNIGEINNIAKELKEKHRIKTVEVFASHYFIQSEAKLLTILNDFKDNCYSAPLGINKITTTNSTGILDTQDSERLKVVDVQEFFI